ncbi:snRNP protein [Theileria orientalis]|uniref:Small nuclear ribonucleoprotein Sm D3 n=1 Tax=Theileria orientalis TaxID=68886 RepID=A0A976MDG0_THEOR|nr:snRNP protein [Theileria orientalis]
MSIGAPVKLLYEGIGHIVTIELQNSNLYRGTLTNVEDNMNCLLEGVTMTTKDGRTLALEQVYLRGAQILFMIFPDMLRHAPMFKANPKDRTKTVPQPTNPMASRPGMPPNVPMGVMGKM